MNDDYCPTCGRCQGCGQMKPLRNDMASGAYNQVAAAHTIVILPTDNAGAASTVRICDHIPGMLG